MRNRSWVLKITVLSIILGMLLAVSLKTQQRVVMDSGGSTRPQAMLDRIRDLNRQNRDYKQQVDVLQHKLSDIQRKLSSGSTSSAVLNQELQDSKFKAGLSAAEGPGIILTLKDSPQKNTDDAPKIDLIIHDSDIRNFINELVIAGAEAISVNDQRITFRSAIRCVGPVVLVNDNEVAAPYEIKAIGDPRTLEGALRLPQGLVDSFPDQQMVNIKQENHIVVPAYIGDKPLKWAKPTE
jgi:uncharacterized protein YlxW (UPF0749 family)